MMIIAHSHCATFMLREWVESSWALDGWEMEASLASADKTVYDNSSANNGPRIDKWPSSG